MGLGGSRGDHQQSRGVCLTPIEHFVPRASLEGTRFGSKHHILVQLAQLYREGISDPLVNLWGPPGGSQKTILCANIALMEY